MKSQKFKTQRVRDRHSTTNKPVNERCFFGANACRAILRLRPSTVRKVIFAEESRAEHMDTLEWAKSKKIAVGYGSEEELDRIAGTKHHQGICVFARDYLIFSLREVLPDLRKQNLLLFLDGIGNPHNVGAILRTAAHFGISYVIGGSSLPKISPAAARTAEGAAEHVRLVRAEILEPFFRDMKHEGYRVVVASLEEGAKALQEAVLPKRAVLVLGAEVSGVTAEVRAFADQSVQIAGTGLVESLNVSATAAIFMHEWSRQARL